MDFSVTASVVFVWALALQGPGPIVSGSSRAREFVVDQWDTDKGLPQNTVTAIAQTPDGYLWVGTYGGLARFDGVRFTPFFSRQHPAIRSDRIHALTVDSTGVLWIGTERGLASYDGRTFTGYRQIDGLPDASVAALRPDSRGDLWIGFFGVGLSRYHAGRFRNFGERDGLPGNQVNGMTEDEPGSMFLAGGGGARIDLSTLEITSGPGILPAPFLEWPLLRAPDGSVWYVGRGGMYRRRNGVLTRYGQEAGLMGVPSAALDHDGNIVAGTGGGVLYLRPGPPAVGRRYPAPDGRLDYFVRREFVDREGTRWIGTDTYGLLRMRPRIFSVLTRADGLDNDLPVAMMRDRTGRIWVGSNCGRTSIIENERIRRFRLARPGCMWAVAQGPDGVMWMSSYGGGLVRMQGDGDSVRTFTKKDGLSDPLILAIHVDQGGTVWSGTAAGLSRLRDGRFTVIDTSSGLPHNNVQMIVEDRAGALWIGTLGGLAKVEGERVSKYTTADGLAGDNVRSLHEDADGVYWIGTYGGGLTRLKDGRFSVINSSHGLFDDVVSAILEDDRGHLWMSGNRGIFHASRDELNRFADGKAAMVHSVAYGRQDGLLNPETNGGFQPSAMKTPDGRLWFATVKGLAIVDPAVALGNPLPPTVALEEVFVDGSLVSTTGVLDVPNDARRLEIHYTGLSSPAPEAITFRYRMDGMDDDWTLAGRDRVAHYSRLRPGRYRFRVDAANRDGVWNRTGAGFDILVRPPVWMTWWFLTLATLLGASGVLALVRARFARLQAAHTTQQEFSRRLIDAQEEERRRIAAELHDSVGQDLLVVKNRAVLALEQSRDLNSVQEQLRQITEVITDAIRDTRAIAHNLRPYQLDRVGLAATIRATVTKAGEGSGVRFQVQAQDVDGLLPPEGEIAIFRIVQECVNNILKHSQATDATVHAFRSGDEIRIIVVDNGRGTGAASPGFGLSSIAERVSLLGGRHDMESEAGSGTTHRIVIPISRGH